MLGNYRFVREGAVVKTHQDNPPPWSSPKNSTGDSSPSQRCRPYSVVLIFTYPVRNVLLIAVVAWKDVSQN